MEDAIEVFRPRAKRAHVTSSYAPLARTRHIDCLKERLGNTEQLCVQEGEEPGLVGLWLLSATLCHCAQDVNSWSGFLIDGK